jgi:hypothetical protein
MTVTVETPTPARSPLTPHVRQVAALGGASVVTGALVVFPLARLAMRLLASLNPEDTASVTDDGFLVGRVTFGGSAQLLLASVQAVLLGAIVYLLVRPLLLGRPWVRTATLALGVATTLAALLVAPDSFDFVALEPHWLPIVLFWLLPAVSVAAFAVLAEHWLAEGSWFQRAPLSTVCWTLLVWLLGGVALVLVLPLVVVALVGVLLLRRFPPVGAVRLGALWIGRLALVVIFVGAVVDLVRDTQQLVG